MWMPWITLLTVTASPALAALQDESPNEKELDTQHFLDVAISEDGSVGIALTYDGTLARFDPAEGDLGTAVDLGVRGWLLDLSTAGDWVTVFLADGSMRMGDPSKLDQLQSVPSVTLVPRSGVKLLSSPDGERVIRANGGADGAIFNRDAERVGTIEDIENTFFGPEIWWSPDGTTIATVRGKKVEFHDGVTGARIDGKGENALRPSLATPSRVYGFAYHPDGRRGATGHVGGLVILWDLATREELQRWEWADPIFPDDEDFINELEFSPDGNRLAFTTGEGVHLCCVEPGVEGIRMSAFCGGRMGEPAKIVWAPDSEMVWWTFVTGVMQLNRMGFREGELPKVPAMRSSVPVYAGDDLIVVRPVGCKFLRAFDATTMKLRWQLRASKLD